MQTYVPSFLPSKKPSSSIPTVKPRLRPTNLPTSLVPTRSPVITGRVLWHVNVTQAGKKITSQPVIDKLGFIYFGSSNGKFYCINSTNGKIHWVFNAQESGITRPSLSTNHKTIYFGTFGSYIYAVHATNGTFYWKYKTNNNIGAGTTVDANDIVYAASQDFYIYALYPYGTLKWKFKTRDGIISTPVVDKNGIIYCGGYDFQMRAFYPSGKQKWNVTSTKGTIFGRYYADAAFNADQTVMYIGTYDGIIHAFNVDNGKELWRFNVPLPGGPVSAAIQSTAAVGSDGTIYVGTHDKNLYALNKDGTLKWKFTAGYWFEYNAPKIGPDGNIYVSNDDRFLYVLSPSGALKWAYEFKAAVSFPVLFGKGGVVYVPTNDMSLVALLPPLPSH